MRHLYVVMLIFVTVGAALGQGLKGDYYIPQGTHAKGFSSLEQAFAAINASGVSGPVRFLIDSDLVEVGANLNLNVPNLSAANNLTIKPASGKSPRITITGCTSSSGATQYAGITVNTTSYVTIDGSNTEGGATQDLTIAMHDSLNGRIAINLYTNTDYIVIKNLKIVWDSLYSGTTTGIYANGLSAGAADSVIIENCTIGEDDPAKAPFYAVRITGCGSCAPAIYASKIYVRNNTLYAKLRKVYFYTVGTYGTTSEISGNFLAGGGDLSGYVVWGILLNYYDGVINIFGNKLYTLRTATNGTEGLYALGTLSAQLTASLNIYNNFFGGDFQHVGTGVPTNIDVISLQDDVPRARIYYNTLYLNNLSKTASTRMACIRFGGNANVELEDNIIANYKDASVAFGVRMDGGTLSSDYNDFYVPSASGNAGYAYGAVRKSLSDWQAATGQDAHSVSGNPQFISTTPPIDLHINGSAVPPSAASNSGKAIPWITVDIDGEGRSPTNPDIGADEFGFAPSAPQLASPVDGGTGIPVTPTFIWHPASGATSYTLQVSIDSAFTPPLVIDESGIADTFFIARNPFAGNTTYYWRVNAANSSGTSDWSSVWRFTTVIAAPSAPVLLAPADGAVNVSIMPTLRWHASVAAVSYRIQISTSATFVTVAYDSSGITDTSYSARRLLSNTIYYWHVNATNNGGTSEWSATWSFRTEVISSVGEADGELPTKYQLYQNYPNPLSAREGSAYGGNRSTIIRFDLPEPTVVTLKVYNILGQEVAALIEKTMLPAGRHKVEWNAALLASGLYFYRIEAGEFVQTRKLILLR